MNTRAKGNRARLTVKRYLESQGYLVSVVELTGRWIPVKDLYGLFDLMAVRCGDVHFIQVTSNQPHSHSAFERFVEKYGGPSNFVVRQYVVCDRAPAKVWTYSPHKTESSLVEI